MLVAEVAKLTPFERFCYWIRERHAIYMRRQKGLPKPWTDDVILQNYRFCNVRRMNDTVSQWLLNNWYTPNFNHPNIVIAVALARHFNKPATLEAIGFPKVWDAAKLIKIVRSMKQHGPVFNGAYIVRGNDGEDKIDSVITSTIQPLVDVPLRVDTASMETTCKRLAVRHGFGLFMAGQVVADLRWSMAGTWADKDVWASMGPGSSRGMCRLYGKTPMVNGFSDYEFSNNLRTVIVDLKKRLKITELEAIDYQNCFCEWDKYERTLNGEGTPKQNYPGVSSSRAIPSVEVPPVDLKLQQVAILRCLANSKVPLTRKQISIKSGVDGSKIGDYAGPRPHDQSDKTKSRWVFPCLTDLRYVKVSQCDIAGKDVSVYTITKSGLIALSQKE